MPSQAQLILEQAAAAVANGDMVVAAQAIESLQPFLTSERVDELREFKHRIDALQLEVKRFKTKQGSRLSGAMAQNRAAQQYRNVRVLN